MTSININKCIFIMVQCCVLFAVQTEYLHKFWLRESHSLRFTSTFHQMPPSQSKYQNWRLCVHAVTRSLTSLLAPLSLPSPLPKVLPSLNHLYQKDGRALPGNLSSRKFILQPLNAVSIATIPIYLQSHSFIGLPRATLLCLHSTMRQQSMHGK